MSAQTGSTTATSSADDDVEGPLHRPVEPREDGRSQLEERHALAGHVLALVHEQLGRVRREPHLHALPVRLLDDVEHRALVVGGLGEQQLVRSRRLEHDRERSSSEEPSRGRSATPPCETTPTNSYVDATTNGRQLPVEAGEARPLSDEDDAAADAAHLHRLERHGPVGGTEQADRERARDRRRRDEAVGREVVARAQTEGEHDQGHGDDRRHQPAGTGAPLAGPYRPAWRKTSTVIGTRNFSQSDSCVQSRLQKISSSP